MTEIGILLESKLQCYFWCYSSGHGGVINRTIKSTGKVSWAIWKQITVSFTVTVNKTYSCVSFKNISIFSLSDMDIFLHPKYHWLLQRVTNEPNKA